MNDAHSNDTNNAVSAMVTCDAMRCDGRLRNFLQSIQGRADRRLQVRSHSRSVGRSVDRECTHIQIASELTSRLPDVTYYI